MDTRSKIAKSLQLLMRDQSKSNRDLAQLVECSENHASMLVRGKVAPTVIELYVIAEWLGVTTDQLGRGFTVAPVQEAA